MPDTFRPFGGSRADDNRSYDQRRGSSTKRLYGYRWQIERKDFLAKHPLCIMCEREDRVTASAIVDHIIPHRGDETLFWDRSNWQPLCKDHHDSEKQRQEKARPR